MPEAHAKIRSSCVHLEIVKLKQVQFKIIPWCVPALLVLVVKSLDTNSPVLYLFPPSLLAPLSTFLFSFFQSLVQPNPIPHLGIVPLILCLQCFCVWAWLCVCILLALICKSHLGLWRWLCSAWLWLKIGRLELLGIFKVVGKIWSTSRNPGTGHAFVDSFERGSGNLFEHCTRTLIPKGICWLMSLATSDSIHQCTRAKIMKSQKNIELLSPRRMGVSNDFLFHIYMSTYHLLSVSACPFSICQMNLWEDPSVCGGNCSTAVVEEVLWSRKKTGETN